MEKVEEETCLYYNRDVELFVWNYRFDWLLKENIRMLGDSYEITGLIGY
jgi:hypothetical protein